MTAYNCLLSAFLVSSPSSPSPSSALATPLDSAKFLISPSLV